MGVTNQGRTQCNQEDPIGKQIGYLCHCFQMYQFLLFKGKTKRKSAIFSKVPISKAWCAYGASHNVAEVVCFV